MSALETACHAAALEMFAAESAMTAAASLVSEALAVEVTITAAEGMLATFTAGLSYARMPVRFAFVARKMLQLKEAHEAKKKVG